METKHFFKSKSVVLTLYILIVGALLLAAYTVYVANGSGSRSSRLSFEQAGVYAVNEVGGGKIILSVPQQQVSDSAVHQQSWTQVQWQNNSGAWIDVNGWRGSFHSDASNNNLYVEWWVGSEIMGDGPFRWVIYADTAGKQYLTTTTPFFLPENNLQTIVVVPDLLPVATNTVFSSPAVSADDLFVSSDMDDVAEELRGVEIEIETPSQEILVIAETPDLPESNAETQTYFVSKLGDNSDGLTWATAWHEMDQIKWEMIRPGDVIEVDGGQDSEAPMQYVTTLRPTVSGDVENPITIQLSSERGRDGQIVLFGGNDQPLPECGQLDWESASHENAGEAAIVFENGVSNIVVDGRKRHGITIHGWGQQGIHFDPDRLDNGIDDNPKNITLQYMHIYNNGDVIQQTDGDSVELYFPASHSAGISLSGSGHTFAFLELHDNGADGIRSSMTDPEGGVFNNIDNFTLTDSWLYNQRAHSGIDNSPFGEVCSADDPVGCDELGAPHMAFDYHFYPPEPTDRRQAFNWCTHNDGIQIDSANNLDKMAVERTIVGPNLMTALSLGGRNGSVTTAWVNNLNLTDVLITRFTHGALIMNNAPEQAGENWKLEHVTIYGHFSNTVEETLSLDATADLADSAEHTIRNSTMVYGQTDFPNGNILFENNCEANLYAGTIDGEMVDLEFTSVAETDVFENDLTVDFATVFTDDYRPTIDQCANSASNINSVDTLFSNFNIE